MVIMLGHYHGGGITGHVDAKFIGPVIVVIIWNRPRGRKTPKNGKKISFGMQGRTSVNPDAEIENDELSIYVFWSWLVDFGVYGVPTQADNDSIVLIIRKCRYLS